MTATVVFASTPTPPDVDTVNRALTAQGWTVTSAVLGWRSKNPVAVAGAARAEVEAFLAAIDDDDDVQRIYVGLADRARRLRGGASEPVRRVPPKPIAGGSEPWVPSGISLGAAARRLDRVAFGVARQLGLDRVAQVEPDPVAQQEQRDADVGDLVGDAGARRRLARTRVGLVAAHPAVFGDQLARLRGDQHRQVLGVVELPPVARGDELAKRGGELVEGRHVGTRYRSGARDSRRACGRQNSQPRPKLICISSSP